MNYLMIFISLFFQLGQPTPTPWTTPPLSVEVTGTPPAIEQDVFDLIGTATAEAGRIDIEAENGQIRVEGRNILPNLLSEEIQTTLAYAKWLFSGAESLFGPFAPLVRTIGDFIFVVLAFFVIKMTIRFIIVVVRAALWVGKVYRLAALLRLFLPV